VRVAVSADRVQTAGVSAATATGPVLRARIVLMSRGFSRMAPPDRVGLGGAAGARTEGLLGDSHGCVLRNRVARHAQLHARHRVSPVGVLLRVAGVLRVAEALLEVSHVAQVLGVWTSTGEMERIDHRRERAWRVEGNRLWGEEVERQQRWRAAAAVPAAVSAASAAAAAGSDDDI